jgi:hypothetical protein
MTRSELRELYQIRSATIRAAAQNQRKQQQAEETMHVPRPIQKAVNLGEKPEVRRRGAKPIASYWAVLLALI